MVREVQSFLLFAQITYSSILFAVLYCAYKRYGLFMLCTDLLTHLKI